MSQGSHAVRRSPPARAGAGGAGIGGSAQALHPMLSLQRAVGNRAASRLLRSGIEVSRPGDALEREADRVADQVMRGGGGSGQGGPLAEALSSVGAGPHVQRKCAACSAGGTTCAECAEEEELLA